MRCGFDFDIAHAGDVSMVGRWLVATVGTAAVLAAASYGDGTTVWFGFAGSADDAYLAFTSPRWHSIEPGQSYGLRLRGHGGGVRHGTFPDLDHDGA